MGHYLTVEDRNYWVIDWLSRQGPAEWHALAIAWDWEDGIEPLHWIIQQPTCDRATALAIFWESDPEYFLSEDGAETAIGDMDEEIAARWKAGQYTENRFTYDPAEKANLPDESPVNDVITIDMGMAVQGSERTPNYAYGLPEDIDAAWNAANGVVERPIWSPEDEEEENDDVSDDASSVAHIPSLTSISHATPKVSALDRISAPSFSAPDFAANASAAINGAAMNGFAVKAAKTPVTIFHNNNDAFTDEVAAQLEGLEPTTSASLDASFEQPFQADNIADPIHYAPLHAETTYAASANEELIPSALEITVESPVELIPETEFIAQNDTPQIEAVSEVNADEEIAAYQPINLLHSALFTDEDEHDEDPMSGYATSGLAAYQWKPLAVPTEQAEPIDSLEIASLSPPNSAFEEEEEQKEGVDIFTSAESNATQTGTEIHALEMADISYNEATYSEANYAAIDYGTSDDYDDGHHESQPFIGDSDIPSSAPLSQDVAADVMETPSAITQPDIWPTRPTLTQETYEEEEEGEEASFSYDLKSLFAPGSGAAAPASLPSSSIVEISEQEFGLPNEEEQASRLAAIEADAQVSSRIRSLRHATLEETQQTKAPSLLSKMRSFLGR